MRKNRKWIQKAIKRRGRVSKYLARVYGSRAFAKNGEVKQLYVNRAIKRVKKTGNTSLLRALYLARTLERLKKG